MWYTVSKPSIMRWSWVTVMTAARRSRAIFRSKAMTLVSRSVSGAAVGSSAKIRPSSAGLACSVPCQAKSHVMDASHPTPAWLKIDFVSDISCPWCAVGLSGLVQALERLQPDVQVALQVQPFELNPHMPPGGQDIGEHLTEKYGSTPQQQAQIRETIRERGAAVGFEFNPDGRGRIYNTFDAHRLLHWVGEKHPQYQLALKMALLHACHRDRAAMDEPATLLAAVEAVGLDVASAQAVLASGDYADEVRARESFFTQAGIHSVPAMVVNEKYLISGGQPAAVYEQALREIAAKTAA